MTSLEESTKRFSQMERECLLFSNTSNNLNKREQMREWGAEYQQKVNGSL